MPDPIQKLFPRYGMWGGSPNGQKQNRALCVVEVGGGSAWGQAEAHQCHNMRGHGTGELLGKLCVRHAKLQAEGRALTLPSMKLMTVKVV